MLTNVCQAHINYLKLSCFLQYPLALGCHVFTGCSQVEKVTFGNALYTFNVLMSYNHMYAVKVSDFSIWPPAFSPTRPSGADAGFVEGGGGAAATASATGAKVFGGSRLKTLFGISKGGGRAPCAPPESASVHDYLQCQNRYNLSVLPRIKLKNKVADMWFNWDACRRF